MNPIKRIQDIFAVAQRHQRSSTQSHCGMLGGAIGVLAGWRCSSWIDMPPAAAAFVVAVIFAFAGLLLCRMIEASRTEKRVSDWAKAQTPLDLAIMTEKARATPDREYLERLQSLRREVTNTLHGRDGGT